MGALANFFEDFGLGPELAGTVESATVLILGFVGLYVIGRAVFIPIVGRLIDRRDLDDHARKPIMRITSLATIFIALTIAFGLAGLENFLLAFAGVAAAGTLAIGFALQNVIRNLVAGIFIYVERPFRIGDWIEFQDHSGIVEDIRLRTTRLHTFDNELLTVSNADLTDNVTKNPVANETLRQRFTVGIGFDDDVHEATEYMIEEAESHPEILEDPAPSVRLSELGDSAVLLQSRFWIADPERSDFVRIRGEYGTNVKRRFDAEGIDIPFPIRTLDGQVALDDAALEDAG